jgi:1-aminocyclopropane-1-carboxylate deaminase/D-cysteine desulfhydrase-like pyridoxal-dependent ACC family enzyme
MFNTDNSLLQQVKIVNCSGDTFNIDIKRDDLIDTLVSGNKWRKLKYNILAAQSKKNDTIITFGGAYSNHLVATAKAAALYDFKSIGIVRGEELNSDSNNTLSTCSSFGMKLVFVSREEYHLKDDKSYIEQLHIDFPNAFVIPEGGANFYGLTGCQEIWSELPKYYTDIVVAAGTGTTAAGILSGMPESMRLHVFSALKGNFMQKEILTKIDYGFHNSEFTELCASKLRVYPEDYFGGYGKYTQELLDFIRWSEQELALPLDQVYTAKAFFQLKRLLDRNKLNSEAKILFIHTGGLQGNSAF